MSLVRANIEKEDAEVLTHFIPSENGAKPARLLLSFINSEIRNQFYAKLIEKDVTKSEFQPFDSHIAQCVELADEFNIFIKMVQEERSRNITQWTPALLSADMAETFNFLMAPPDKNTDKKFWLEDEEMEYCQLNVDFLNGVQEEVHEEKARDEVAQQANHEPNPFDNLPIEILLHIFSFMGPKDVLSANATSKMFGRALSTNEANFLWKEKFQRHFGYIFKEIAQEKIVLLDKMVGEKNWYKKFRKTYAAEYQNLTTAEKELFSAVKESDVERLEELVSRWEKQTPNKLPDATSHKRLYQWALDIGHPAIINLIYKIALTALGGDSVSVMDKDGNRKTILHWAILLNQSLEHIETLITAGCSLDEADRDGFKPIHFAIIQGRLDIVKCIIESESESEHNPFLEQITDNGLTPLMLAAEHGKIEIAAYLLSKGARPYGYSDTALHRAIRRGCLDIVKSIIKAHPDMLESRSEDRTPLVFAAEHGKTEIVAYLLSKGANQLAERAGKTALHYAVEGKHVDAATLLMKESGKVEMPLEPVKAVPKVPEFGKDNAARVEWDPNNPNDANRPKALPIEGELAIRIAAAQAGWSPKPQRKRHFIIKQFGHDGEQIIHYAVKSGNLALVKALVENNPHAHLFLLNQTDNKGRTPILLASQYGFIDIVAYCIENKAWLEAVDDINHKTALQYAIENYWTSVALQLIKAGAKFKIQVGEDGKQLIHHAIENGNLEIIKALIDKDSSLLNQVDAKGCTPLILAVQSDRPNKAAIIKFLLSKKSIAINAETHMVDAETGKPNHRDHGKTALIFAIERKESEIAAELIKAGASLNGTGVDKLLIHAVKQGKLDIVKFFIEADSSLLRKRFKGYPILFYAKSSRVTEFLISKMTAEDLEIATLDSKEPDDDGKTALYLAVEEGDIEKVKLLLQAKASLTTPCGQDRAYPIHAAFELEDPALGIEIAKALLLAEPSLLNQRDGNGETPLHRAAKRGNLEMIDFLLAKGAPVDAPLPADLVLEKKPGTPFSFVLRDKNVKVELVDKFLQAGASLKTACENLFPHPIFAAIKNSNNKLVELLADHDPDCLATGNENDEKPLLIAATASTSILKYLIDKKVPLEVTGREGKTALHLAIENKIKSSAEMLLKEGANILCKWGVDQVQPIHLAAHHGNFNIMKKLIDRSSNALDLLSERDACGRTPLFYAAKNRHEYIVKYLISSGVNVNVLIDSPQHEDHGKSLLYKMIEEGKTDIALMLIRERNIDLNLPSPPGKLPLLHCAIQAFSRVSERGSENEIANARSVIGALLAKNPALVNQVDGKGLTPLMSPTVLLDRELLETVLGENPQLEAKNNDGKTALWLAMEKILGADKDSDRNGYENAFRRIIEAGGSLKASVGGLKPIHYLINYYLNKFNSCSFHAMLNRMSSPKTNNQTRQAIRFIKMLVKEYPQVLMQRDDKGRTPLLQVVAMSGDYDRYLTLLQSGEFPDDLIKHLLLNGANPNDSSNFADHNRYKSALHIALEKGDSLTSSLLIEYGATLDSKKPILQANLTIETKAKVDLLEYESRRAKQGEYKRYLSIFGYQIKFFGKKIGLGCTAERKLAAVKAIKEYAFFGDRSSMSRNQQIKRLKEYKNEIQNGELNEIRKRLGISFRSLR